MVAWFLALTGWLLAAVLGGAWWSLYKRPVRALGQDEPYGDVVDLAALRASRRSVEQQEARRVPRYGG